MRFLRKSLTGLFLVSLALGMLSYAGIMIRDAVQARMNEVPRVRPASERVFAVNVVQIQFETVVPKMSAFGEIQSRRTLELRAAVGGALLALDPLFVEGGRVEAGQLLARIDPANAQSALDRAESDVLDAQAEQRDADRAIILARDELNAAKEQVALREQALQRQENLRSRNVGTSAAVEIAELAVSAAKQSVLTQRRAIATAEARIEQAVTRLRRSEIARAEAMRGVADTEVRAKFSGTLSDVAVVAGRLVSANERLAQLVDPDLLEVAFRVSTQQYARLLDEAGQLRIAPVTISLDVFGTNISTTGQLSREGAAVGEGQTGRLLFATLEAPRGFKPGDFVTVRLDEPELQRVARLPATALNARSEVLEIGEDNRLQSVPVNLLRRQGDDVLVRARGLDGKEVVAERTPLLGTGIRVKPIRADAAKAPAQPEMLELSDERRQKIRAFVEANTRMPTEAKTRILGQLDQPQVPAVVVERIEARMGG